MWTIAAKKAWKSPLLRGAVMVALAGIAAGLLWGAFASHYREQGRLECEAAQRAAVDKANREQQKANEEQQEQSDELADAATEAAEDAVAEIDNESVTTKKEITDVYRDPPATAPVVLGSCVHPVDDRVQDRIERAVEAANG